MNPYTNESLFGSKAIKFLLPVSVLAIISRGFPVFNVVYYSLLILFSYFIFKGIKFVFTNKSLKIFLILITAFGIWAALTSAWSDYPLITLTRSAYLIFISLGAVLGGCLWNNFYGNSLGFLFPANVMIILLSLFSIITNIPSDSWTGGHGKGFMGFAGHQNTLASIILFTIPAVFSLIKTNTVNSTSKSVRAQNLILIILLLLNLIILILTYSRASILSLLSGVVVFLILIKKWNVLLYSLLVLVLLLPAIYFTPVLKEKANDLIKKDFPSFYSSREFLWQPSQEAAAKGGFFGLGYGMSDPEILLPGSGSHYEAERYVREKGNSVLAVIEETGYIGLVLFLLPVSYLLLKGKNKTDYKSEINVSQSEAVNLNSKYILAALFALLVHSQFEAWWVGVGSVQLPLFFFYAGALLNQKKS